MTTQNKIFIDGGAHKGESVRLFRDKHPNAQDYKIISFEPNPALHANFATPEFADVEFHGKAIWICDGDVKIYKHQGTYGSALHSDMHKIRPHLSSDVPCIDFSKWMTDRFSKDDHIILKLDIEGSEYEVLNKMIVDGSIDYVYKLYIEWHVQWRPSITQEVHDQLVAELAKRNIPCFYWEALEPETMTLTL